MRKVLTSILDFLCCLMGLLMLLLCGALYYLRKPFIYIGDIVEYCLRKIRKFSAILHTKKMAKKFPVEIKESIENSKIYHDEIPLSSNPSKLPKIFYYHEKPVATVKRLRQICHDKIAILSCTSFPQPCDSFTTGSEGQDRELCRASYLYNVLSQLPHFYEESKQYFDDRLRGNVAIYTPNIRFFGSNGESFLADVINRVVPQAFILRPDEDMLRRMKLYLNIAQTKGCKGIALVGFGWNYVGEEDSVQEFKDLLNSGAYSFEYVVIGISGKQNYEEFKRVFNGQKRF